MPVERIGDDKVDAFGKAMKSALRNPDNPVFARAYVETTIGEVVVMDSEVRIKGLNAALTHQAAAFAARGELVPSFAQ